MRRVLIVECQQEVSSFNPVPSRYADFQVHRGAALLERGAAPAPISAARWRCSSSATMS